MEHLRVSRAGTFAGANPRVSTAYRQAEAFAKVVGASACVAAIAVSPPVFHRVFAMLGLLARERTGVWVLSASLFVSGMGCALAGARAKRAPALLLAILILLFAELGTRMSIKLFASHI